MTDKRCAASSGRCRFPLDQSASLLALLLVLASLANCATVRAGIRIKDLAVVEGNRVNRIDGFGVVTGLNGTGGTTPQASQLLANYLDRMGHRLDPAERARLLRGARNNSIAAVHVTAELPVFQRPGTEVDVKVAAVDGAKSLQGGELMPTDLYGVDGKIYARALGPISLGGGFSAGGDAASAQKNHTTVGIVPGGALVEECVHFRMADPTRFNLFLRKHDFSTASRVSQAINARIPGAARALDPATINVWIPNKFRFDPIHYISIIEEIDVIPDSAAAVVINERTGTIVFGHNVRISQVAVTHANLFIATNETPQVSQPLPFSDGETEVVPRTRLDVAEENRPVQLVADTVTIRDLVDALNALGANARDLIPILQQIKAAGGLHAQLIFK